MAAIRDATDKPLNKKQVDDIVKFFNEKLKVDTSYHYQVKQAHGEISWYIYVMLKHKESPAQDTSFSSSFSIEGFRETFPAIRTKSLMPDDKELAHYFVSALTSEKLPYWANFIPPHRRKKEYFAIEDVTSTISSFQKRIKDVTSTISSLQKRIDEVSKQLDEMHSKIAELQKEKEESQKQLDDLCVID